MDKAAIAKSDYLRISRPAVWNFWDKEKDDRDFVFLTHNDQVELIFCGLKCLEGYIKARMDWWIANRDRILAQAAERKENMSPDADYYKNNYGQY